MFLGNFVIVFTNRTTFPKKIFSRACILRGKNYVQLPFDDSYKCYMSKIDIFEVLCVSFH